MSGIVKEVKDHSSFESELENAGAKLVVVDFHAKWCGPCRRIAPVVQSLAKTYINNVVFLKVDVDENEVTAAKYSVQSMPTFIFIRSKVKIDEMKGADQVGLQEKIKSHAGSARSSDNDNDGGEEVKGYTDLKQFFLSSGCNCLNESDDHTHANVFDNNETYLESDCDEQLILSITFSQPVKIHSMKINAPSDGKGPKTIKLFVNQPSSVDFDQAERMEGVQKIDLTEEDIDGNKIIPLRFVKFQNVTNLVIFVANNQGDEETTVLKYLKLIGIPLIATNMNEFKRVAGKAGESH